MNSTESSVYFRKIALPMKRTELYVILYLKWWFPAESGGSKG